MIDKRQCKYIKTIAECHSISKAAQVLYISQPSLSRLVKKVEDELGVALFDRDTIPLGLTAAGQKYLEYITRFEHLDAEMQRDFAAISSGMINKLVIATIPVLGSYVLPKIIPPFAESYPSIDLQINEDNSRGVLQQVEKGLADLALTNLEPDPEQFDHVVLCSDPVVLAAPYNEKMRQRFPNWNGDAAHPQEIELSTLENETLIVLRPWQNMRIVAESICRYHLFTPQRVIEAPSLASALSLVGSNRGMTFICPSYVSSIRPASPIIYFAVDKMQALTDIRAIFKKGAFSPVIKEFCACATYSLGHAPENSIPLADGLLL